MLGALSRLFEHFTNSLYPGTCRRLRKATGGQVKYENAGASLFRAII